MPKMPEAEQINGLFLAFKYVRDWSLAIDGGANCGDFSAEMAKRFRKVVAFEPADDMAALLRERFKYNRNVVIDRRALWHRHQQVKVCEPPKHAGISRARYVEAGGEVEAVMIDALGLRACGLLKVDVEGAELMVLQGAVCTLMKFKPVVMVEIKKTMGARAEAPIEFLTALGFVQQKRHGPDRIFSWGKTK
jgi:FkbM family methyltransferase